MEIIFYTANKAENSTKLPTGGVTVYGRINNDCSIENPVILFAANGKPQFYNYAYIPEFSRYYWVNNWSFGGGYWSAAMSVDVLATYRDEIGNSTQYVLRSAAENDGGVIDGLFPMKPEPDIVEKSVDIGWSDDPAVYVLGVIGGAGVGTLYYSFTPSSFDAFCGLLFTADSYTGGDGLPQDFTLDLFKAQFNPLQYVTSCRAYPAPVSTNVSNTIPVGWRQFTAPQPCSRVSGTTHFTFTIPGAEHPDAVGGSFFNARPYTQVMLTVPCFGQIELSASDLGGGGVNCDIAVFAASGDAILTVKNSAGKMIRQARSSVGADVQISQFTKNYGGFASGVAGAITSGLTGNFVGAAAGIASAAESIMPQMSTAGSNETMAECAVKPTLTYRFFRMSERDRVRHGRPLCQNRKLSTLPGYVQCENADVIISGTANENTLIKQYLEGGFFYE